MKKRIFSALMAIVMCTTLISTAMVFQVSADDGVSVSVGSASGKKGDTVTVTVDLSKNPGITALGLNVGYDTSKVKLVGVSDAGTLPGEGFSGNTNYSASSYRLYWSDDLASKNNTGTGTLATLKFELVDDFDDSSPITVSVSDCYDADMNDVSASSSGGSIKSTASKTSSTTTTTKKAESTTKKAESTTKKITTTTKKNSGTVTTRRSSTTFYDDSYGCESITESTTDFTEVSTTEESTTEESTTEESTTEVEEEKGTLSKTKAVLIVLIVCFAIVGVAIIISIVKKSKQ